MPYCRWVTPPVLTATLQYLLLCCSAVLSPAAAPAFEIKGLPPPPGTLGPAPDLPEVRSEHSSTPAAGIAGHVHKYGQQEYEARAIFVHSVAIVMLTVSIGMAVYATFNFRQRMTWLA